MPRAKAGGPPCARRAWAATSGAACSPHAAPTARTRWGLSCVELAGVENGELIVRGADLLDGTPIFDIKPYLPYVDAYPDARGGFTDTTKEYALQVVCPDALLCKVPENKRAALSGVLKNDPRPAYQHDPERVYTLDFGENKVRFSVDGDILKVVDIL